MFSRFQTVDLWLVLLPLLLTTVGIAVIYATTVDTNSAELAWRQTFYALAGIVLYSVFAFTNYHAWRTWALPIYLIALVLLLLVPILGDTVFGAKRWIDLSFIQFSRSVCVLDILY